jgi:hypothetical protein
MIDQIPASVATAISAVMSGIRTLGKDGNNGHQRYDFVSTDKFLAAVNPLCAAAGLIIIQDEDSIDIRTAESVDNYGKAKMVSWLTAKYTFVLAHKDGSTWGPVKRTVMVTANGAQAFGSAQSYALKQFMRSLFQISTGDQDDADLQPADELPANRKPANQQAKQPALDTAKQDKALRSSQERTAAEIKRAIAETTNQEELKANYISSSKLINALPDDLKAEVIAAKDAQKTMLMDEAA